MKILLTGMSGTGKTTTLSELQKYGYLCIDLDSTGLCRWKNIESDDFSEYGDGRDYTWLTKHGWYCDIEKFGDFISYIRDDKIIFVAGMVENVENFSKFFDKIFILDAKRGEVEKRLIERTNNHFAKKEDERDFMFNHTQILLDKIKNPININTEISPQNVAQLILKKLEIVYKTYE